MTTGVAHLAASGNSGRQNRIIPKVPTLSSTPTSSTAVAGRASAAASGSQVCTGHSGALIGEREEEAEEQQPLGGRVECRARAGW